jgi:ABC-2 type transport system permease protein
LLRGVVRLASVQKMRAESRPAWLHGLAQVLPMTHGLEAVRDLLAGGSIAGAGAEVLVEAAVGGLWLAAAYLVIRWFCEGGRRNGSIEFGG